MPVDRILGNQGDVQMDHDIHPFLLLTLGGFLED